MRDDYKSKDQLLAEIDDLRRRLSTVQTSEARDAWAHAEAVLRPAGAADREPELFHHPDDLVYSHDLTGRITFINAAAESALGYTRAEALHLNVFDLITSDRRAVEETISAARRGESTQRIEIEIATKTRHRRLLELTTRPVKHEGATIGVQVLARDVTDRRRAEASSKDSEEQFRALFELAPVGIARVDLSGRIVASNRALQEMSGYTAEELHGRSATEFALPEEVSRMVSDCRELLLGKRDRQEAERRYYRKDRTLIWANVSASVVRDPTGAPLFIVAMIENISDRKRAEEALRQTNDRLTGWVNELEQRTREIGLLSEMGDLLQACRTADEAYAVIGRMGRELFPTGSGSVCVIAENSNLLEAVVSWGPQVGERLFGPDDCWALRRGRAHFVHDHQLGLPCRHMHQPLTSGYLCLPMMAQGSILGLVNLSLPEGGRLSEPRQRLAMTVAEHISLALANLRLQESLRAQSIRDPLTGLFNRRYMEESLDREMRRAVRGGHPVGILMLDLDHFKRFNDVFGHDAGDALLREVGTVLQRSIRAEDIACRYGGEEFTLILPQMSLPDAAQRAEQIRDAIKRLNIEHRRTPLGPVTVSLGVAVFPDHGPTADAVLRAADTALYEAKAGGRDRVKINSGGPGSLVDMGR